MWGQKAPSKHENGGKKRPQNHKVGAESAPAQIRAEKVWGKKCHHISNCGGTLTTTYYIQGAGAPAKTKNYVNADGVYIFSGKGPTFSASCKTYKQNFWKG